MKIQVDIDSTEQWWFDFVLSCNNDRDFENELKKFGIKMIQLNHHVWELEFDNEQNYTMFRLKWL